MVLFFSPRESLWAREVLGFPQILQGEFLKKNFSIGIRFQHLDRKFIVCLVAVSFTRSLDGHF